MYGDSLNSFLRYIYGCLEYKIWPDLVEFLTLGMYRLWVIEYGRVSRCPCEQTWWKPQAPKPMPGYHTYDCIVVRGNESCSSCLRSASLGFFCPSPQLRDSVSHLDAIILISCHRCRYPGPGKTPKKYEKTRPLLI